MARVPSEIAAQLPAIALAAQPVYDAWTQDADGVDEVYGTGGICDEIASAVAHVLAQTGIECVTHHWEQDNHTVVICQLPSGVWEVDIPWRQYEEGGWYTYRKLPDVTFTASMVSVEQLSRNPADFEQYTESY